MKRKLISVFSAFLLIITTVYPALTIASATTWNGLKTTPTLSGGVYQISTGEQLAWFANAVNTGSSSIKGVLLNDIYLNDDGSYTNQWTPIGSESNPFKGTFDGGNFTIHGVYINSTSSYVGLFGNINIDTPTVTETDTTTELTTVATDINIKNIKVVSSKITGYQNVGGIVGYGHRVGMENCSYNGEVTGTYNSVGGIIGWAYADSVVSQCCSLGTVTGAQRTGGISGFASGDTVVTKCYSKMSVNGTTNVGGIVGTLTGSDLKGCFFLGSVKADDRAGGIVGYSAFGNMSGAYTISTMTSTGTSIGGAVGVSYGGTYQGIFYSYETAGYDGAQGAGRTTAEMQVSHFIKELNVGGVYFCYDYTNINNSYPVLTWMLKTDVWLGELTQPAKNSSGTYLISKASELAWFSALVNGTLSGVTANPAANATVTADILLNISVYDDTYGINEWTPIGTSASPYTGTFDGGGYNIAGVYTTSSSGTSGRNVGLFGYVGAGNIRNTVVIDGLIAGIENVGGLVGYLSGGTVNNCCCNSEIRGDKAVGGIVGNLASSTSSITSSCMIGTITGTNVSNDKSYLQNVGGIAGYNNRATITKCFTYGKINASLARYVGGLVGNNAGGTINNSYNASPVIGSSTVGGLVGYNNNGTLSICYSVGKVTGSASAGMAFGNTSGANVTNCYFDNSFATSSNTVSGATSLASASMTGSTALTNMNMSTSNWKATAQDQYYFYYPVLISTNYSSVISIKTASVNSVRRVQSKYVARVEIDGRASTYYETLQDAINYAAGVTATTLPVIYLVRDVEVSSTITISHAVGLYGDDGATLKRASTLTGAMLDITSALTLGSVKYGDDNNVGLYVSGNSVLGTQSGIVVESGGTLNVSAGVSIANFQTAANSSNPIKGAAINNISGTVKISGGRFDTNVSKSVAGVLYNNAGTVSISGGTFQYNEGTQGAVLYNDNGTVAITGGTFTNNIASLNGGVASTNGTSANTVISGTASLTGNTGTVGGALSVLNYGTLEVDGGTISSNVTYSTGGAIQIEVGSEAIITGGTIANNSFYNNSTAHYGSGIYNNGTLTMKGAAQIDSSNDVYLVTGKTISITDRLTCSGYAATITPQTYTEGLKVLDGSSMSISYTKFGVSDTSWHTLASGTITSMATTTVAVLSKSSAYSVNYISIADAVDAVAAGESGIITVVADSTISKTITVKGDITIVCDDTTYTATRSGSFYGVMFDIQSGGVLRFGESILTPTQQSQTDHTAGTDTAGSFVLDGGFVANGVVGAAAVNVQTGGQFYIYDGATIQNCKNTTTGTVVVNGKMYMYGGTIRNNSSCYGGGVYVKDYGTLDTFGGVIAGNTSTNGGAAVYALGTVTKNIHTYNYWYIETLYDTSGNITGYADAVEKTSAKTDILIPTGEAVWISANPIVIGTTQSDVYVRNLSQIPAESTFTPKSMTVDLKTYTVGTKVISGTDLINYYTYFTTYKEGYYILYDGTLGLNKLVAKSTSGLTINRTTALVSGIDLTCATVGEMAVLFENDKTLIAFYDAAGTRLRNSSPITTGCYLQLTNTSGTVLDTITLVVYGDINEDYKIDAQDSVMISAIAAGMLTSSNISAAQLKAADINFDGTVTTIDADHTDMSGVYLQTVSQK
jgi:hypothetical protein